MSLETIPLLEERLILLENDNKKLLLAVNLLTDQVKYLESLLYKHIPWSE